MKKLNKAEIIILALALVCVVFTTGYFTGKSGSGGTVTVERLAAPSSPEAPETPDEPETPAKPEAGSPAPEATDADDTPAPAKLNINTATAAELDRLPGVGEVIAGNIVTYRDAHGGFAVIDELMDVDGIGQAKFDAVKDMITVG